MVYLIIYIIIVGLLAHFKPYVDLENNVLWYGKPLFKTVSNSDK